MRRYLYSLMTDQRKDPFSFCIKIILHVFAFLYRILLEIRNFFWKTGFWKGKKVPLVVISIGNITLGGTGKTPFVKWLVKKLLSKGKKVAVLTRGYQKISEDLSDEAVELRSAFPDVPVWVGKDRVALAEKALSAHIDTVILDDGFQYRRLYRNLDIVLIDATNPFGNGRMLPRGILREKPASLRRADFLVLTRTDGEEEKLSTQEHFLKKCVPDAPILFSIHRLRRFYEARSHEGVSLESLRRERVIAFCGIGNPQAFKRILEGSGLRLIEMVSFMDHHRYREKDLAKIDESADALDAGCLITTEKDFERLRALDLWPSTRLVIVEVELVVTKNEDELLRRLDTLSPR